MGSQWPPLTYLQKWKTAAWRTMKSRKWQCAIKKVHLRRESRYSHASLLRNEKVLTKSWRSHVAKITVVARRWFSFHVISVSPYSVTSRALKKSHITFFQRLSTTELYSCNKTLQINLYVSFFFTCSCASVTKRGLWKICLSNSYNSIGPTFQSSVMQYLSMVINWEGFPSLPLLIWTLFLEIKRYLLIQHFLSS